MTLKVKISEIGYENMLIHILQYGNKSLKKSQEVMGLLFGIRIGEILEIRDAVPLKHGPDCEKPFSETDFVSFSEIEKTIENGLELMGFYSSHPNMGYYVSQNEIKNLLYFHDERKNDYAIALIGDHAKLDLEGDLGLQAFHLKNPEKGQNSDFETIELEVDPPSGMDLYLRTKYLIEQGQKHEPYIVEKGTQLSMDDSLWDDAFGSNESEEEKLDRKIAPILKNLEIVDNLKESFITDFLRTYQGFLDDLNSFAARTFNIPSSDIVNLTEAIDFGLENVQQWFDTRLQHQAEKIMSDYQRTFDMVKTAHQENEEVMKLLLIKLIKSKK